MNHFNFINKNSIMKLALFIIYFTVNLLFVIKYGVRQEKISIWILVSAFLGFHILIYKAEPFFIKNIQQVFFYSALIYFLLIGSFLIESSLNGIVYNHLGITYLASALPFAIIGYCYLISENLNLQLDNVN